MDFKAIENSNLSFNFFYLCWRQNSDVSVAQLLVGHLNCNSMDAVHLINEPNSSHFVQNVSLFKNLTDTFSFNYKM